ACMGVQSSFQRGVQTGPFSEETMKTQVSAIRSVAALDRPAPRKLPTRKILWAIQDEGGTAQPLIFVLAGHGDAWVALGLARALGPEHTVYGVQPPGEGAGKLNARELDRKSTRLNSSHRTISYAVFCLKKKKKRKYQ